MRKTRMDPMNILITGTNTTLDNGESAMASMAIRSLKRSFPRAHFVVGSTQKQIDSIRWRQMLPKESKDLTILGSGTLTLAPRILRALLVILRYLPEYLRADICIDISGDGYSDATQHSIVSSFTHSIQLLGGRVLRKPVFVCAQSVGPFKTNLTRFIAKFVLNNVSLVTVREEISKKYLQELGVNKPLVEITADFAFLLEPIARTETRRLFAKENINPTGKVLVGLVLSEIISKWAFSEISDCDQKYSTYINIMAEIADYLVETLCVTVILMPQCIGPFARHDDRIAMKKVFQKVKNKDDVKMINGDYIPSEIRGIIAECKLIITAKMHAAIASVSTNVPVVVMAYSFKTRGIFGKQLDLEETIVDVRNYNSQQLLVELKNRINYIWQSRDPIIKKLQKVIPIEREQALKNALLIESTLNEQGV